MSLETLARVIDNPNVRLPGIKSFQLAGATNGDVDRDDHGTQPVRAGTPRSRSKGRHEPGRGRGAFPT